MEETFITMETDKKEFINFIKNEYVRGNDIELSSIQVKLIDVSFK